MTAALKSIPGAANSQLGAPPVGKGADPRLGEIAERIMAARLRAAATLVDGVEVLIEVRNRPARGSQVRLLAVRDLFKIAEGAISTPDVAATVDSAVRVLVVDQSQLGAELAKRVRSV